MSGDNAPVSNLDAAVDRMLAALAGVPDLRHFAQQSKTSAGIVSAALAGAPEDLRPTLAAHAAVLASTADVAVEIHALKNMKEA